MSRVALRDRIVEVIAERGPATAPSYQYGSGCIVLGGLVLTAAHVIAGAHSVVVRHPNKAEHRAHVDADYVGALAGLGPDLALLKIDDATINLPAMPLAIIDRDSMDAESVERCHAIGYPWFAERASPQAVRDTVDAFGYVPVLSKLASGLVSLHVRSPPRPLPPQTTSLSESEWSGMSGAPVVAAGCLLGVVTEHAPREGPGTITVTPLALLEADASHPNWGPGVPEPARWWQRLGVDGLASLERLPRRRQRPEPSYRATVRQIHARTQLVGREQELGEIDAFATSSEGYRWLIGGAWVGKTALLAAAVVAGLPDEVDVVSYFLSRRESDADSNHFLSAVVPQVADLLEEDHAAAIDVHAFRALWERAASAAEASGRHLLLVVDGLDEDVHPAGSQSVAALLPTVVGGSAHVLVSSRAGAELPRDVAVGHPLWSVTQIDLEPFAGAAELAELARQELDDLKQRDDGLVTDILALLTAAAGALAVADLATLTADEGRGYPAHTRRVRRVVSQAAAHSLQAVGSDEARRYQFAHGSLLDQSRSDDDLSDPDYRDRINAWADDWGLAGWPHDEDRRKATPRYLVEAYPSMLAGDADNPPTLADEDRLARLVSDVGWADCAVATVGVDAVLASVATAAHQAHAPATVTTMLRFLGLQARHLRQARTLAASGYTATALGWEAVRSGVDEMSRRARAVLDRLPAPQLIPLWSTDRTDPRALSLIGRHDEVVAAVAAGVHGRVVSVGRDGAVRLWDPGDSADPGRDLGHHSGWPRTVAISANGLVASGAADGTVRFWDSTNPTDPGRDLGRHPGQASPTEVHAVAVNDEGLVVSGAEDGAVWLWNASDPTDCGRELGRHEGLVWAVAVTADGLVVSVGADTAVRLWDTADPAAPGRELGRHPAGVRAVALRDDGRVVTAGWEVRLWNPADPTDPGHELGRHYYGLRSPVLAVAVGTDGRVVTGGMDGAVRLWDSTDPADPGREVGRHYDREVSSVTIATDGRVISGGADGAVLLWDPANATDPGEQRRDNDRGFLAVALTADGRVVSGSKDWAVRLWDPANPADPGREIGRHRGAVSAVAVTGEGQVVSAGADGFVRLWDPATPADFGRELGHHDGGARALVITPSGLVVSGGEDGTLRQWDPANPSDSGREVGHHEGPVWAVAVTADGRIVSASDAAVWLWNPGETRDPGRELGHHNHHVIAVTVTSDGLVASCGMDRVVRLWDPANPSDTGRELGRHDGPVWALAATAEGFVVSGGEDRLLQLWNPRNPADRGRQLRYHDSPVWELASRGNRLCVRGHYIMLCELSRSRH